MIFIHRLFKGKWILSLFFSCYLNSSILFSLGTWIYLCSVLCYMNSSFLFFYVILSCPSMKWTINFCCCFFIFESPFNYWCIIKLHIQLLILIRIVDFVACLPLNVTFIIMQHYINSYDVKLNGPFHYLCTTISQIQTQLNHPMGY